MPSRFCIPTSPTATTDGNLCFLPVDQLRSSYSVLRPGAPRRVPEETAQLPIRVVPSGNHSYEIIDGFKRLDDWKQHEHHLIPVVVEPPSSPIDHKRLLLLSNCPPRTLTALDEARVVHSLIHQDGLSPKTVARRLRHKHQWVARRMDIATHLSPVAQNKLAQGCIGPTLAHALCPLPSKDQKPVLQAILSHGLKLREALPLISAYRLADQPLRRKLLHAPLGVLKPSSSLNSVSSPTAVVLQQRLQHFHETLVDLALFIIPKQLAPADKRRLQAKLRKV